MVGPRTNNTSARTAAAPHPDTDINGISYMYERRGSGVEFVIEMTEKGMDSVFTADQRNLLRGGAVVAMNQSRIVDLIALARNAAG